MSLVKAEEDLKKKGMLDRVIHLAASTATVAEAAEALGVEPGMIAKTLSFLQEEKPVLILTEGTAKIDNRKYKDTFHIKAKMIPFEEVETQVGHAPGGVSVSTKMSSSIWTKACGSLKTSTPPPATTTAP